MEARFRNDIEKQVAAMTEMFHKSLAEAVKPIKNQLQKSKQQTADRFQEVADQREDDTRNLQIAQDKIKAEMRETSKQAQEASAKIDSAQTSTNTMLKLLFQQAADDKKEKARKCGTSTVHT
eukprot:1112370-Rhodomonas_salina.1